MTNAPKLAIVPVTSLSVYRYFGTYLNPFIMATNFPKWQKLRKCSLARRVSRRIHELTGRFKHQPAAEIGRAEE